MQNFHRCSNICSATVNSSLIFGIVDQAGRGRAHKLNFHVIVNHKCTTAIIVQCLKIPALWCACYTVNLEIFMYPFFGLLNFRHI